MTARRLHILGYLLLSLPLLSNGCFKADTLPQLEIQVVDESGTVIAGAYVGLFENSDEWAARENPLQVWRRSDSSGKVLFVDLKEIPYFIYVRFEGKDNSLNEISTPEPLQVNQRERITVHIR